MDGLYADMWNEQLTKKEDLTICANACINDDIKEENVYELQCRSSHCCD